jgi:hypothetical protein
MQLVLGGYVVVELNQRAVPNLFLERDNLHSLSLSAFDIQHNGLKNARLIKNTFLDTVVEFMDDEFAGLGHIRAKDLSTTFNDAEVCHKEIKMITGLMALPSLDCYTLKRGLEPLKLSLLDEGVLELSDEMVASLFPLMSKVTRPLIQYLYTDDNLRIKDTKSLLGLIQNTDRVKVKNRLNILASNLEVSLTKLPNFLMEFGKLFLSISYFENIFIEYNRKLDQLLSWAEDGMQNSSFRNDPNAQREHTTCDRRLKELKGNLESRFNHLFTITQINWDELKSSEFRIIQREILSQQANLAIGLCGLTVKILEWEKQFPSAGGSPQQCFEFLSSELNTGLENLLRSLPLQRNK